MATFSYFLFYRKTCLKNLEYYFINASKWRWRKEINIIENAEKPKISRREIKNFIYRGYSHEVADSSLNRCLCY
jgi:hypothetical protein